MQKNLHKVKALDKVVSDSSHVLEMMQCLVLIAWEGECYGLNICVPSKLIGSSPNSPMWQCLEGGLQEIICFKCGHEGWDYEKGRETIFFSFCHVRIQQGRESLSGTESADTSNLHNSEEK